MTLKHLPVADTMAELEKQFANRYCVIVWRDRVVDSIHGPFDTFVEAEEWTEENKLTATGITYPLFTPT